MAVSKVSLSIDEDVLAGADYQMHDVGAGRRMQVGDVQLTILSDHCWN